MEMDQYGLTRRKRYKYSIIGSSLNSEKSSPLSSSSSPTPVAGDEQIIYLSSMAQGEPSLSDSLLDPSLSRNTSFSRLNAQAPEFVPNRSPTAASPPPLPLYSPPPLTPAPFHVPIQVVPPHVHHRHHLPVQYHHQFYSAGFAGDQEQPPPDDHAPADHATSSSSSSSKSNKLSDEATSKILNQVEYYFSDLNLATTDHLMRFISKDPEGFVPISVVASFKKIKALINSHSQLATVLRNSSKLVVHEDGKKVRRQHPLTQSDMKELQSRIIVAENLPEDHCHQNLMKIFSAAGSVKTIRTCQPQTSNNNSASASRSAKADGMRLSNKLHAFVEYETTELAEKAVTELNDEGNWRSGLRVRLMPKLTLKPGQVRGKKGPDGEMLLEEEDASMPEQIHHANERSDDSFRQFDAHSHEQGEEHNNDKESGQRKARNRQGGRGKGRGRGQYHHNNRNHVGTPHNSSVGSSEQAGLGAGVAKQPPGPRMPDGTRGFAMGRGRPVTVNIAQ